MSLGRSCWSSVRGRGLCSAGLHVSLRADHLLSRLPSRSLTDSLNDLPPDLVCSVEWHVKEGDSFSPIVTVATVRGPARQLLLGERVALNLMARCSGIATKSRRLLMAARKSGWNGIVAGTRKTTPGASTFCLRVSGGQDD